MNLVDALKSEPQRTCPYQTLIAALKDEERQALQFALRNPAKAIREIHEILTKAGYSIGREMLSKHRNGTCTSCPSA